MVKRIENWLAVNDLIHRKTSRLEKCLTPYRLNLNEFYVLYFLYREPGHQLAITEFERGINLSQSGLSRMISHLESKQCGVIERIANPDDKRSSLIALTDHGMDVFKTALTSFNDELGAEFQETKLDLRRN